MSDRLANDQQNRQRIGEHSLDHATPLRWALYAPDPRFEGFFGVDHPGNPVVLSEKHRRELAEGETLWVYGYFHYTNFINEHFEMGFIARWQPPNGLVAGEQNQNYAYHRRL